MLDRDFCHTKDTQKRQRSEKLSGNFSVCALISKSCSIFHRSDILHFESYCSLWSTIVHCPVTVSKQTINLYPIPSCRNIQRLQMLCIRCAIFIVKSPLDYMISWFSQKTNGQIWFVCFFTLHGKQIKFVRLFFGRIYGSPICFSIFFYL